MKCRKDRYPYSHREPIPDHHDAPQHSRHVSGNPAAFASLNSMAIGACLDSGEPDRAGNLRHPVGGCGDYRCQSTGGCLSARGTVPDIPSRIGSCGAGRNRAGSGAAGGICRHPRRPANGLDDQFLEFVPDRFVPRPRDCPAGTYQGKKSEADRRGNRVAVVARYRRRLGRYDAVHGDRYRIAGAGTRGHRGARRAVSPCTRVAGIGI